MCRIKPDAPQLPEGDADFWLAGLPSYAAPAPAPVEQLPAGPHLLRDASPASASSGVDCGDIMSRGALAQSRLSAVARPAPVPTLLST